VSFPELNKKIMFVTPIRWGILGTGLIAAELATALKAMPDADIVAVGSRTTASADAFADRFGIPHRHASYRDLAHDPDVDIVYVATPNTLHAENSLMCLNAGKPVFCEKPFTVNAKEAEEVIRIAKERKLFLMEAMCTRHMPIVREAKRLIEEGAIGDVRMMHGDFGMATNLDPDHRLMNLRMAGGVLLDVGIYPLSLASYLLGPIEDAVATAYIGKTGVDYQIAVSMRHGEGRVSALTASLEARSPHETVIMGTKGRIHLKWPAFKGDKLTLVLDGGESREIHMPYESNGYQFELSDAMQCLREGRSESAIMPLDETLALMRIMDRIRGQIGLRYPGE
jgi:predicted dehydrogenase